MDSFPAEAQNWAGLDPGALRPTEVRPALLCDYYEHNIEHAPPRDPSGCMQRREYHYVAPPAPLHLVRSKLHTKHAGDTELMRALQQWADGWIVGRQTTDADHANLERLAAASSLPAVTLLDVGRAVDFLDDDQAAADWFRSALIKAELVYASSQPGDSDAVPLLDELDQTKALWRLKDYRALERRFSLAMRLQPQFSPPSRRAGYLHAEMLFYRQLYAEAAAAIVAVQGQHDGAKDLGRLDDSDSPEMRWVLGLFLSYAHRDTEAIEYLAAAANGREHKRDAAVLLFSSLLRAGRFPEATACLEQYVRDYSPAPVIERQLRARLEFAKQ